MVGERTSHTLILVQLLYVCVYVCASTCDFIHKNKKHYSEESLLSLDQWKKKNAKLLSTPRSYPVVIAEVLKKTKMNEVEFLCSASPSATPFQPPK